MPVFLMRGHWISRTSASPVPTGKLSNANRTTWCRRLLSAS